MNFLNGYQLILASQSPRRKELLEKSGLPFRQLSIEVDEVYPPSLAVEEVAEYLARLKAEAALNQIGDKDLLLTADSIVLQKGIIYGKPQSIAAAKATLRSLSDSSHEVITGVCLATSQKQYSFSAVSKVWMAEISSEEIDFYVEEYQPFDKAGAYGIQEWMGICKIKKIEGTYNNIMGLPMEAVYHQIRKIVGS